MLKFRIDLCERVATVCNRNSKVRSKKEFHNMATMLHTYISKEEFKLKRPTADS